MKKIVIFISIWLSVSYSIVAQTKILFDAMKGESAANADWVVDADVYNVGYGTGVPTVGGSGIEANAQRIPTPPQSGISATTLESYWSGGLSAWAVECAKKGMIVESLPIGGKITFGDATNPQDLSKYQVYVVCEPNILFSASEKTAIMKFVEAGGGLFMIGNHLDSDRNFDGFDSPMIWNDLMSNNTVKNNAFGLVFNGDKISQTSSNVANLPSNSILNGSYGKVTKIQTSGGNTLTINASQNATVTPLIYKTGSTSDNSVLAASATFGNGRVFVICDSSLPDDGTGDPNDVLYDGWIKDANGNHRVLIMNATEWLAAAKLPTLTATSSVKNVSCKGGASGQIDIVSNGGTGTYAYKWSNGSTANPATQLKAGLYTVTVTSGTQITILSNIEIKEPAANLLVSISVPNQLDCKNASVKLVGNATGGTQPYTFTWSALTQGTTISAQGEVTQAGNYVLKISDSNGCSAANNVTIVSDYNIPSLLLTSGQITCVNPSAKLNAETTTLSVAYSWSGPNNFKSTKKDTSTYLSGVYTCIVTNSANGCTAKKSVTITENGGKLPLQVTLKSSKNALNDVPNAGAAEITVKEGLPPYTYTWRDTQNKIIGTNSPIITGLFKGIYTCEVTDANGCKFLFTVQINQTIATQNIDNQLFVKLIPNPVQDVLTVQTAENLPIVIHNLLGEKLLTATTNQTIDVTFLPKGVYIIVVNQESALRFKK